MARAPRRTALEIEPVSGPFDDAVTQDQERIADDLSNVLDALKDFDQGAIRGMLYRKPPNGVGKFEWIEDIVPPFDLPGIHQELKDRFNGGNFELRVFAGGRIRKSVSIDIVKENRPIALAPKDNGDITALMGMMMQMNQGSSDRQMQMMMQMSQQAAAAQQASTQMMVGMMTAIVPALAGGKEKTSELMQAFAAMQPKPAENDLEKTITTFAALKSVFKDDTEKGPGFDADDIVGSVVRMAGPVAGAVGRAFQSRNGSGAEQVTAQQVEYPPHQSLMLDNPTTSQPPLDQMPVAARHPVLALIRDDVLFAFTRQKGPELAAEMVYDTIEAHGVTEDQINDLVGAFALSPDWLSDLAVEGIDLRSNPEWANAFLGALVSIHTDPEREREYIGGQGGSDPNPGPDGEAIPPG